MFKSEFFDLNDEKLHDFGYKTAQFLVIQISYISRSHAVAQIRDKYAEATIVCRTDENRI